MFDIGWTELVVIAVVAIVVIGPKDLPRAMRTVGQFTGTVVHDFRNILAVVDAGLNLIARQPSPARIEKTIGEVRNALTRGEREGLPVFIPSLALSTDNAAMIAAAGLRLHHAGVRAGWDLNAEASLAL